MSCAFLQSVQSFMKKSILVSFVGGFGVATLFAQESLISNPPFKQVSRGTSLPVIQNFSTQGSINERFELAGIFSIAGELKFSIHDKKNKKPLWLTLGESVEGVKLESYESTNFGVVMSQSGKQELLILREVQQNSGVKKHSPSYRNMTPPSLNNYPKPPPRLPNPNKLIEQLRKQRK